MCYLLLISTIITPYLIYRASFNNNKILLKVVTSMAIFVNTNVYGEEFSYAVDLYTIVGEENFKHLAVINLLLLETRSVLFLCVLEWTIF